MAGEPRTIFAEKNNDPGTLFNIRTAITTHVESVASRDVVYKLLHFVENQIDSFGVYRDVRQWYKENPDEPMPDILKGDADLVFNNNIGRLHPIAIYGKPIDDPIDGKYIKFEAKAVNRIVLDTEICTPTASCRLSTRELTDISPNRMMKGGPTDLKLCKSGLEESSTIDNNSSILYLHDFDFKSISGDVHDGLTSGYLQMAMPLNTIKTVQLLDVTLNLDYWQYYAFTVNRLIDSERAAIELLLPGYTIPEVPWKKMVRDRRIIDTSTP